MREVMIATSKHVPPVAVVGVSALFPGSIDKTGFWSDILAGKDLLSDVPSTHWLAEDYYDPDPTTRDHFHAARGGFIPAIDFAPMDYGMPPSLLNSTDSAQLLAMVVAQKVLEDASNGQFSEVDRDQMSVILGVASTTELVGDMCSRLQRPVMKRLLTETGAKTEVIDDFMSRFDNNFVEWNEATFPGLLGNVVAGRVANRFDLGGTNMVVDAACASSLAALEIALNELYLGDSRVVITGGVDCLNNPLMYMCFAKTTALSTTGDCRPFSAAADGTILGEGVGMVALKRLEDAERDGDRIYAVIRGLGSSSDGRAKAIYAPVAAGQAKAMRRAYQKAGYGPETVELVEAHGTGTRAGDAEEFTSVSTVFAESGREGQWAALGSVKSQIGHTKAAAGAAGLFKIVMALHHKVLPPTIKVDEPSPKLSLGESPFYLQTTARPWVRSNEHPRRGSVSAFGFGGTNFHVTVEEYLGDSPAARSRFFEEELVLLSGTPDGLAETCRAWADAAREFGEPFLRWAARDSQARFDAHEAGRLSIVTNARDFATKLDLAAKLLGTSPTGFTTPRGIEFAAGDVVAGDVAVLFPGQGSQYLNMARGPVLAFDDVRSALDDAVGIAGLDGLAEVIFPRTVFSDDARADQKAKLTATDQAQPAIGAISLGLWRLLEAMGLAPAAFAGHSYGEVAALRAAGAFDDATFFKVSAKRGALMAEAARTTQGAMTAVVGDINQVRELLDAWSIEGVVVANHNARQQVVLSGSLEGIESVEQRLADAGIESKRLRVATAFHSPIVSDSSVPFEDYLRGLEWGTLERPVFANSEAAPYDAERIVEVLAGQIGKPVRFVEMLEAMWDAGVRKFVEVGPGSVLSRLVEDVFAGREGWVAVSTDHRKKEGMEALWLGLARLALAGVELDYDALWDEWEIPQDPRAKEKPRFAVQISGANYGKPYPRKIGDVVPPPVSSSEPVREVRVPTTAPSASVQHEAHRMSAEDQKPGSSLPLAPPPQAPQVSAAPNSEWLRAYQAIQEQTARAHAEYQRAIAENHSAFLRFAETSVQALIQAGQGTAPTFSAAAPAPSPHYASVPPAPAPSAPLSAAPTPQSASPRVNFQAPASGSSGGFKLPSATTAPVASPSAPSTTSSSQATSSVNLEAVLMDAVATKTGYPVDMLELSMHLESDLGIDSIKRVEILSAVQDAEPSLPDVDTSTLATLNTLGEILDYLASMVGASKPTPVAEPASASAAADLHAILLDAVATKTGYPVDMLELSMHLESDLGIDSIKRVEILSAVQDAEPSLPDVDTSTLATLNTLEEILVYLQGLTGASVAISAPTSDDAGEAPAVLEAVLMDAVASKTGYPVDMLELEMNLESDLGIDSIKRVEILSAVQDAVPSLPDVDTSTLATLSTLNEILVYLQTIGGGESRSNSAGREAAASPPGKPEARRAVRLQRAPRRAMTFGPIASAKSFAISADSSGVADALIARLIEEGFEARLADTAASEVDALIILDGLGDVSTTSDAIEVNRKTFESARAFAPHFESGRIKTFVTVQDTGGDFGFSGAGVRAWTAGIAALTKTAGREWQGAFVKALDIARGSRTPSELAELVVDELLYGGPEIEVGIDAAGVRQTLVAMDEPVRPTDPIFSADDVIVVSGGARGVTAGCVVELARTSAASFVLLGRTAPMDADPFPSVASVDAELKRAALDAARAEGKKVSPRDIDATVRQILASREIESTLSQVRAAGGKAIYVPVDVRDRDALGSALKDATTSLGEITGLVHAAGVLADAWISKKSDDAFARVFETKVDGLAALLEVLEASSLKAVALFSSVAARGGNAGQSDYAMANEVLNKVAHDLRSRGVRAVSLGWGPWDGGMVTSSLKAHFESQGIELIGLASGARAFVDELRDGSAGEVVIGGGVSAETALDAIAMNVCTASISVRRASLPDLVDHEIQGKVVVPFVQAVDWAMRAGAVRDAADVQVFNGIQLEDFEAGTTVEAVFAEGAVRFTESGKPRYMARVGNFGAPCAPALEDVVPGDKTWTKIGFYSEPSLFHGPLFQAVEEANLNGVWGTARLNGGRNGVGGRQVDAVALDGALQLAVLWAQKTLGLNTLPLTARRVVWTGEHGFYGGYTAVLRGRGTTANRATADVALYDEGGQLVASIEEVELFVIPSEA